MACRLLRRFLKGKLNLKQGLLINDESQIGNEILAYLVDHQKAQCVPERWRASSVRRVHPTVFGVEPAQVLEH